MVDDKLIVRKLTPEDVVYYRDIRLQALAESPDAFAATFEEEERSSLDVFSDRLAALSVFGAFADGGIVGMVGLYVDQRAKFSHKARLWGLFVRCGYRGGGTGSRLISYALSEADQRTQQVILTVSAAARSAIDLYERSGFKCYGIEPRAMKTHDGYVDELLMVRLTGE
jgi:ribosomal protein S18 acetylase RimI-like enzyme